MPDVTKVRHTRGGSVNIDAISFINGDCKEKKYFLKVTFGSDKGGYYA